MSTVDWPMPWEPEQPAPAKRQKPERPPLPRIDPLKPWEPYAVERNRLIDALIAYGDSGIMTRSLLRQLTTEDR